MGYLPSHSKSGFKPTPFPNPTNDKVTISFSNPNSNEMTCKISNQKGNEIITIEPTH